MVTSGMTTQHAANITRQDMIVGAFDTHAQAEKVVNKLIDAGVAADHISLIAQGLELREQLQGYINTGDVARQSAGVGAWTGGLFGLLSGVAFLWVPALGPLIVLGPLVNAALGAATGGAAGGLFGTILGHQIEKQHIPKYQSAIQAGKILVVVHGTPEELENVRRIMNENNGQDVYTYAASAA